MSTRSRPTRPDREPAGPPGTGSGLPPTPSGPWGAPHHRAWQFAKRVFNKADEDAIFFMAGAISFNVLVAIVPLLVFAVGISGMVLSARFLDPTAVVMEFLGEALPAIQGDLNLTEQVREQVARILAEGTNFTIVGALFLIWFSTRLVGTLRTALRDVFDMAHGRGIVGGKWFDAQVVVVGGLFFLVNLGLTSVLLAVRDFGLDLFGVEGQAVTRWQGWTAHAVALVFIWLLFAGIYRYLPPRRVPWRTTLIAASFAAVLFELLKAGFGWYVTEVANYRSTYGNLISVAVLVFWIYYSAIGFILAGEVAQVSTMRRARRVQIREVHGVGE